jgi:hypothetical protein
LESLLTQGHQIDAASLCAGQYTNGFWNNSSSCNLNAYKSSYITPTSNTTWVENKSFGTRFATSFAIAAPLSIVAGVALSLLYLFLFIKYATRMVIASVAFSLITTLLICIASFAVGAWPMGIILLIVLLIAAGLFWWIRGDFPLVGRFLSTATQGLVTCHGIVWAVVVLKITGVLILAFYLTALIAGSYNGTVVLNPARTSYKSTPPTSDIATCYSGLQMVPCCTLSSPSWIGLHYFIASVFFIWCAYVILELRLYITADTMAQWYFSATPGSVQPSTMRAVKHGLTSSFGSVCFGAAILAMIDVLREALKRRAQNSQGWMALVCCIINCIGQCLLSIIEQFTRFVSIATAITGKAFIPAGQDLWGMMSRLLLPTANLWWIPSFVLQTTVNLIALSWAAIVFFLTWAAMAGTGDALSLSFAVGGVALFFAGFVLNFTASILIDCTNTIYICFCYDRDRKVVTNRFIHEVYLSLPPIRDAGLVIEQPGGEHAYGSSTAQAPPPQQQIYYQQPPPPPPQGVVPGYAIPPQANPHYGMAPPPPYPAQPPPPYQPYSHN